jgi:hypothetical protein
MSLDDCGMVCAGVVDGGASRYIFSYAEQAVMCSQYGLVLELALMDVGSWQGAITCHCKNSVFYEIFHRASHLGWIFDEMGGAGSTYRRCEK